jgi:hypothetical protein
MAELATIKVTDLPPGGTPSLADILYMVKNGASTQIVIEDLLNIIERQTYGGDLSLAGSGTIDPVLQNSRKGKMFKITQAGTLDGKTLAADDYIVVKETIIGTDYTGKIDAMTISSGADLPSDVAYAVTWNGNNSTATKNAIYDAIESNKLTVNDDTYGINWSTSSAPVTQRKIYEAIQSLQITAAEDIAFDGSWDGDTDPATKNTIYDVVAKLLPPAGNMSDSKLDFANDVNVNHLSQGVVTRHNVAQYTNLLINFAAFTESAQEIDIVVSGAVSQTLPTLTLTTSDNTGLSTSVGDHAFVISNNVDTYLGQNGEGVWREATGVYTYSSAIVGSHTITVTESKSGSSYNTIVKNIVTVSQPSTNVTADHTTLTGITYTHKSGVRTIARSSTINSAGNIINAVLDDIYHPTNALLTLETRDGANVLNATGVNFPSTPIASGSYNYPATWTTQINSTADELIMAIRPLSPFGQYGTTKTITTDHYYDGFDIVGDRVLLTSLDAFDRLNIDGGTFAKNGKLDETQLCSANDNLQSIGGKFSYPKGVYIQDALADVDYSAITGYKGEMFTFASYSGSIFNIEILDGSNLPTGALSTELSFFAQIESVTGWVSLAKAYDPFGAAPDPSAHNDAALVVGSSSTTIKQGTFGSVVRSGTLLIMAVIKDTSKTIEFSSLRVTDGSGNIINATYPTISGGGK